jgi:membrane protease YdiL (CAAX protease family)
MTTSIDTAEQESRQIEIPQYRLPVILFMFAWPMLWFMFLIHVARPLIFGNPPQGQFVNTYVFFGLAILGNAAELIVGLVILRREGYKLTIRDLRDRARLRWPSGRMVWGLALAAIALYTVSILIAPIDEQLATVPGFTPPAWFPPMLNPTVEIAAAEDLFPDIVLGGNYLFFAVFLVYGLVFNIIGEELYYRSMLLPKMRGVFGKWDWVANGTLFSLKHVYTRWLWGSGIFSSLAFALLGGPVGSVYMSMLLHWAGSYLPGTILGISLVFGGG